MKDGDKTEQATPKKKRESRRKGQIAKSQDLTSWAALLVGLHLLPVAVGRLARVVAGSMHGLREVTDSTEAEATVGLLGATLRDAMLAAAPLMLAAMGVAALSSVGQTGLLFTLKPIVPDFKRINPKNGVQRLFSIRSAWETLKQLLKITIIIGIAWPRVLQLIDVLVGHGRLTLGAALPAAGASVLGLARAVTWTVFLLSLADYGYQRSQHRRDLKMTKQQVRDEHKNAEGDGSVKARMRSMQRSMARNRMLADMGNADVVITNPTHIAVALQYDAERGGAPRVLAVGAGSLAARIRERAAEASIPVVESKPLARALWRACDVGDEVPVVLYEAVAKVLVFVRRLDRRISSNRPLDLPSSARVDGEALEAVPRKRRR